MPLVTIVCTTFNHENFIADALESFVKQKTNFKFQVLVCHDKSTDRTPEIIEEYAQKYPDIIKHIVEGKKWDSYFNLLSLAKTKYLIVCEGDDYFTNPYKLQKQVNFLEANPDFSISFHPVKVFDENLAKFVTHYPDDESRFHKTVLDLNDLLQKNFIQTNSCMYRWRFNESSTEDLRSFFPTGYDSILPCDHFLHLLHAEQGKIGFMPDIMAVYRLHDKGFWAGVGQDEKWFLRAGLYHVNFWELLKSRYGYTGNDDIIDNFLVRTYEIAKKYENEKLVERLLLKIKIRAAILAEKKLESNRCP